MSDPREQDEYIEDQFSEEYPDDEIGTRTDADEADVFEQLQEDVYDDDEADAAFTSVGFGDDIASTSEYGGGGLGVEADGDSDR